jgi:hypothetical protein
VNGVSLSDRLLRDAAGLARQVAADLGPTADRASVERVVRRFLEAVAGGRRVSAGELARLRADGATAARDGRPLAEPLDVWLSTAWVAWEHAVRLAAPEVTAGGGGATERGAAGTATEHGAAGPATERGAAGPATERGAAGPATGLPPAGGEGDRVAELARLGSALLRAGDDIAAALADGYTGAERALAARAGATRRAVLDELLSPVVLGAAGQARRARRAALVGLDPVLPYGLVVARSVTELEEEGSAVDEVTRRLARDPARRPHLVSVRDGDLVVVEAGPWRGAGPVGAVLRGALPEPWWAAGTDPDELAALPSHYAAAVDALRVLPACRPPGAIHAVASIALERALVADPALAAAGVEAWLGPLGDGGRAARGLLPTLEAWLAAGGSITGTARRLGVAPRTVSYRLERAARLLGVRDLDATARERLSTALLTRRLLAAWNQPPALRP